MSPLLRLTAVMVVLASVPVLAEDERDCFQQTDPQLRIKGCSQMIQRDPADAAAYHNRAVAYGLLGDLDHAIADYTKTVEIKPDNAGAYENRGRAYASKGDYTNAIADAMKASELGPSTATQTSAATPKSPNVSVTPKHSKAAAVPAELAKTAVVTHKPSKRVAVTPTPDNVTNAASGKPVWRPFTDGSTN